ncbi:hypothetical protein Flexsi_0428 [Flexistipes sinusarabici DSM 4947]|uniref:Uncharacterized protein n=1 Tax=Flexistipes sinusarabici (strain ATCC 49648 / DSM 4947 / MAS 10) TaxID=717231 RepID=F8E8Z2_FLESM|nr:hypothetical protein [Flexistipes sinusarabici]AEI14116.1 hypothetical protein Flexsi_0428 [Flexistipes sinusarabici DSM 4947]
MQKNSLFEEFKRRYNLKGANSTVKQDYRIIENFCQIITEKYPVLQSINLLSITHKNTFYKYLYRKVQKGEVSKNYAKDCLYAVNKLYKKIGKPELCYDVQKIINSMDGKRKITVTEEEFENIKQWRKKYGKILPPG